MFKDIKELHKHCLAVLVILLMALPFLTGFDIIRHVTVRYDGQEKVIRTNTANPESIIQEAGVQLDAGDSWRLLGANRNVQDGSIIEVVRAKSFVLIQDNEETVYRSGKPTVGEALKSLGIRYKKNKVYPSPDSALQEDMKVYVLDKDEKFSFSEESEAPGVEYVEDFSMALGNDVVQSEGRPGVAKVISKVKVNDDGSTMTQEIGRELVVVPEKKIVRKGMGMSVKTPEGYKRYKKKMYVEVSAYTVNCGTGSGMTAIGLVPYEGIVAVDPRVIPYYTKMYIPGYGIAMAGDTGGSIVGNKIDVFMSDWHRAIQWGRRDMEIYILED